MKRFAAAAVFAIFTAPPVLAQSASASAADDAKVVIASDPASLVNFFFDQGVPAQLTSDNTGDPLVEFRLNTETYQVFFYDCTDNKACRALQFYSGYKLDQPVGLETLNAWNAERRYLRAYRSEEGAARIEMDVYTGEDGVSYRDFSSLLNIWREGVGLFQDKIGW